MDRILLIGLVTLIAMVGGVFLLGSMTPVEHSATRTLRLDQSIDDVWDLITDFENAPSWRPELHRVERGPDQNGNDVWVEIGDFGEMPLAVVVFEPPLRLAMEIADDSLPWGGVWTYEFDGDVNGTRLTITEDGFVRLQFYRFLNRYVFGYDATIAQYLENLARHFGEEPNFID